MTKGDALLERGANRLQRLADRAAASGGLRAKLAEPLADDASLLRRMKPSLMVARARGDAPTNLPPAAGVVTPHGPQLGKRPKMSGGPSPFLVIGAALVVGIALAKLVDWRGHAHPRD